MSISTDRVTRIFFSMNSTNSMARTAKQSPGMPNKRVTALRIIMLSMQVNQLSAQEQPFMWRLNFF